MTLMLTEMPASPHCHDLGHSADKLFHGRCQKRRRGAPVPIRGQHYINGQVGRTVLLHPTNQHHRLALYSSEIPNVF